MSFSDSLCLAAYRRGFSKIAMLGALASLALSLTSACAVGSPDALQTGGMGGASGGVGGATGGMGGSGGMSSGGMGGAAGMMTTGGMGGSGGMSSGGMGGSGGMSSGGMGGSGGMSSGGMGGSGGMGSGGMGGTCVPAMCPMGMEPFPGVPGPAGCCKADDTCGTMDLFGGCA